MQIQRASAACVRACVCVCVLFNSRAEIRLANPLESYVEPKPLLLPVSNREIKHGPVTRCYQCMFMQAYMTSHCYIFLLQLCVCARVCVWGGGGQKDEPFISLMQLNASNSPSNSSMFWHIREMIWPSESFTKCGSSQVRRGTSSLTFASLLHLVGSGLKRQQENSETLARSRRAGVCTGTDEDFLYSLLYVPSLASNQVRQL